MADLRAFVLVRPLLGTPADASAPGPWLLHKAPIMTPVFLTLVQASKWTRSRNDISLQSAGQETGRKLFVESVGDAEPVEDVVARVALDKDGPTAHVDVVAEAERVVDDLSAWRLVEARSSRNSSDVMQLRVAGQSRKQRLLRPEGAAGNCGRCESVRAEEDMRCLGMYCSAGSQDGQLLRECACGCRDQDR